MTTHDLEAIEPLVDRAVMLSDGRLTRSTGRRAACGAGYRSGSRSMSFLASVWLVMRKDLLIELRSREIVYTTLFFAVSCVLVFAFGFVREGRPMEDAAPASSGSRSRSPGTLALGRAFERERQNETLRALLMAPVDRPALYVGKADRRRAAAGGGRGDRRAAGRADVPGAAVPASAAAAGAAAAGTIGFAAVGTLFAAMLARARSRDVLLPMLLYPITVPVIIAGVRGTAALLQPIPIRDGAGLALDAGLFRRSSSRWRCGRSSR